MGADQEARFAIELDVQGVQESENLADALTRLQAQIKADQAAVTELQAAMRRLQQGGSVNIDTFKQLRNQLAAKKASLASAQEAYVKLGGTFGQVGKTAQTTGGGLEELLASAQSAGGPLGQLAGVAGRLKGMLGKAGAAGAALVLAAAIAAVVVGAIAAIAAVARFALVSADAVRSERLLMEAATGGRVAADALGAAIDGVAGRVATARGQLERAAGASPLPSARCPSSWPPLRDRARLLTRAGRLPRPLRFATRDRIGPEHRLELVGADVTHAELDECADERRPRDSPPAAGAEPIGEPIEAVDEIKRETDPDQRCGLSHPRASCEESAFGPGLAIRTCASTSSPLARRATVMSVTFTSPASIFCKCRQ